MRWGGKQRIPTVFSLHRASSHIISSKEVSQSKCIKSTHATPISMGGPAQSPSLCFQEGLLVISRRVTLWRGCRNDMQVHVEFMSCKIAFKTTTMSCFCGSAHSTRDTTQHLKTWPNSLHREMLLNHNFFFLSPSEVIRNNAARKLCCLWYGMKARINTFLSQWLGNKTWRIPGVSCSSC